jgi:hypothetical protein
MPPILACARSPYQLRPTVLSAGGWIQLVPLLPTEWSKTRPVLCSVRRPILCMAAGRLSLCLRRPPTVKSSETVPAYDAPATHAEHSHYRTLLATTHPDSQSAMLKQTSQNQLRSCQ